MHLSLTEEQRLIQSSALDWLAAHYDFRQREASVHRDGGAPSVWHGFAEMGWLALPLPEAAGGLGGGPVETGLLMQAMGRHLVVEPFHACVVQAGRLLALAGDASHQAHWLPGLMDGEHRLALVHAEPGDGLPWRPRRLLARRVDGGWTLSGHKRMAVSAPGAAAWIVSARDPDDATQLFIVEPGATSGLHVDAFPTSNGGRAADIRFEDVTVSDAAQLGDTDAGPLLQRVLAEGVLAHCWEATGAMHAVLEQTVAYTSQRRQFGQPLGAFQVVQHRLAEMAVHCAEAQAACEIAALRIARDPGCALDQASMVKSKAARAARFVAQEAVQLHGAMGVCEELPVASTFRHLQAFAGQGGDAATHATAYGRAMLESGDFATSRTLEAHNA